MMRVQISRPREEVDRLIPCCFQRLSHLLQPPHVRPPDQHGPCGRLDRHADNASPAAPVALHAAVLAAFHAVVPHQVLVPRTHRGRGQQVPGDLHQAFRHSRRSSPCQARLPRRFSSLLRQLESRGPVPRPSQARPFRSVGFSTPRRARGPALARILSDGRLPAETHASPVRRHFPEPTPVAAPDTAMPLCRGRSRPPTHLPRLEPPSGVISPVECEAPPPLDPSAERISLRPIPIHGCHASSAPQDHPQPTASSWRPCLAHFSGRHLLAEPQACPLRQRLIHPSAERLLAESHASIVPCDSASLTSRGPPSLSPAAITILPGSS